MKKLLFFTTTLLFLSILVGCSNNSAGGGKMTAGEKMALNYVTIYLNGNDEEAKRKYVEESIHPDVAMLFQLGAASIAPEDQHYKNPSVLDTVKHKAEDGTDGNLTLIKAEDGREIIVLLIDQKVTFAFVSDNEAEDMKASFDSLRAKFK
ncbi:hypothetical protein [Paenibacillus sp. L3-i20]|uniref:hypothetical protein n=1 Tax=Paenibacillus sp. L3-i20 TaxID=2905833 RepID=UPI001EDEED5A|nr:hypothetical protein [Paenibacillus sp. L3-i20]GKU78577.1 hypothetical protein L3i20_v229740 [Paenibacillus sp. L3-i20]